jgi:uncharacterized protein with HEPN domain
MAHMNPLREIPEKRALPMFLGNKARWWSQGHGPNRWRNAACRIRSTGTAGVPSRNDPAASLADILENLERIEGYVAGLDREAFGGDTLRRDAVERCLERICEAAFRLGEKAAELAPSQPWGDIRGMGQPTASRLRPYRPRCLVEHRPRQVAQPEGRCAASTRGSEGQG